MKISIIRQIKQCSMKWAFFSDTHNYGDCSRAIEIARQMKHDGHTVRFFHHGGDFVKKITEAGIDLVGLEPEVSKEQHEVLMAIDQQRAPLGTPLPFHEEQIREMVTSEIKALREFRPDGAYCGLNISCMISVPYLKIPSVTFVPTALCPAFFQKGLASFPNSLEKGLLLHYLVPGFVKKMIINRVMLGKVMKHAGAAFNKVRVGYGLPPLYNYPSLARGDLTLLPDLPELSGLKETDLPPGYKYCGPLFAHPELPVPDEVRRVFDSPGLKMYCAMGSSGSPELLKKVISILKTNPGFCIVCATTSIIDPTELGPNNDRFFATRFLPAPQVNELADIAVIHGGQGTVQTAVWAGTPVVGIGFQWEQQANLDGLVHAGAGIRIPILSVSEKSLLAAVEKVRSKEYRSRMAELKDLVRSIDGARNAVQLMNRFLEGREAPH